jgi:hypothetical protein
MTSSDVRERARRLLLHEAATRDARGYAGTAERVWGKLRDELTGLVGSGGVAALLSRSLVLAQRDFPQLGVVVTRPDLPLAGLADALNGTRAAESEAVCTALIEQLLGLLVSLMGEDLGLRPVRKLWPGIDFAEEDPGSTERDP